MLLAKTRRATTVGCISNRLQKSGSCDPRTTKPRSCIQASADCDVFLLMAGPSLQRKSSNSSLSRRAGSHRDTQSGTSSTRIERMFACGSHALGSGGLNRSELRRLVRGRRLHHEAGFLSAANPRQRIPFICRNFEVFLPKAYRGFESPPLRHAVCSAEKAALILLET